MRAIYAALAGFAGVFLSVVSVFIGIWFQAYILAWTVQFIAFGLLFYFIKFQHDNDKF